MIDKASNDYWSWYANQCLAPVVYPAKKKKGGK